MVKKGYRGNEKIQVITTIGDFVLLNALVYLCLWVFPDYTPGFFMKHNKVVVLAANFAMVVAKYFFPTIIHNRKVDFRKVFVRVFKLVVTQTALMFFLLRMISEGGGFFRFMLIFFALFLVVMIMVRFLERGIISYIRISGRNSQSILFFFQPLKLPSTKTLTGFLILYLSGEKTKTTVSPPFIN